MPKPYSMDLRERVVAALDEGESAQEVADRFDVSAWTVRAWRRRDGTGSLAASPHGGGQRPALDGAGQERLRQALERDPDATLPELIERVGRPMGKSAMSRWCLRLGLRRKKSREGVRAGPSRRGGGAAGVAA